MVSPSGGGSAGWLFRRVVGPPGGGSAGDECAGDESAGGESAGHRLGDIEYQNLSFLLIQMSVRSKLT